MSIARVNPSSITTGSIFIEIWDKVISVCFRNEETREETADNGALIKQSIYIQHLFDNLIQANTIYEPRIAESIIEEETQKIEKLYSYIK